ncbi:MAG: sigma-54 dependent transcriptional regulator [Verrucomicrobiota bacterium]
MKPETPRILLVDDEPEVCRVMARILEKEGFATEVAHDGKTALQKIRTDCPEVLITDVNMPDMDGWEVLRQAKALNPDLPVVIVTGSAGISQAVAAMRASANDYLAKPFKDHELIRAVQRAVTEHQLKRKLKQLAQRIDVNENLTDIMGPSDAVRQLIVEVNLVANSNFNVIIIGETGSGKEVIAHAIHQASQRSHGPFVPVDCGAIPETLVEGELFGYDKGAFTGAVTNKRGKFETAAGGTLFLDEVLNLPLASQAKLLRALQERVICRLGGTTLVPTDVRVVVAANQSLETATGSGKFRVDLFFRLNEFLIRIPALRNRKEDIIYLAKRFLDLTNRELNKSITGISQAAVRLLLNYAWPGNVRQLRSTIRRAVLLASDVVTEQHLDILSANDKVSPPLADAPSLPAQNKDLPALRTIVERSITFVERAALVDVLGRVQGNKAHAARLLQIDYKTMQSKIKKYGINIDKNNHHENQTRTRHGQTPT